MNKMIKVRIQCSERVLYDQVAVMTQADWQKLKATPERRMEDEHMSPLPMYIDLADPLCSRGFEDIEMEVVDEDGKTIEPLDSYEGGE